MFMKVERHRTASKRDVIAIYILAQSPRSQAKCWAVIHALELYGLDVHPKFSKKLAGYKNLWELRIATETQHRILFTITINNVAVLLHAFNKKTQKTPLKEIELAFYRQRNYETTKKSS